MFFACNGSRSLATSDVDNERHYGRLLDGVLEGPEGISPALIGVLKQKKQVEGKN